MKLRIVEQDRKALLAVEKGMSPQQRLQAFINLSRRLAQVSRAGARHRTPNAKNIQMKISKPGELYTVFKDLKKLEKMLVEQNLH